MSWDKQQCSRDDVVAALRLLFDQFAVEEQRQRATLATGPAVQRNPINPTELRHALSRLPGEHYRIGEHGAAHAPTGWQSSFVLGSRALTGCLPAVGVQGR